MGMGWRCTDRSGAAVRTATSGVAAAVELDDARRRRNYCRDRRWADCSYIVRLQLLWPRRRLLLRRLLPRQSSISGWFDSACVITTTTILSEGQWQVLGWRLRRCAA